MNRSNSPILVSEALASQLNGSLPIYINAEDVNKNPDLSHLLNDLVHRLTPTGISKSTHADLAHTTHTMRHARQKYLNETTFHRLVQDVVYQKPKNANERKILKEASEALSLAEVQSHLHLLHLNSEDGFDDQDNYDMDSSSKQCLFGITPKIISARTELVISDECLKAISDEIEEHLANEWTKIAAFKDPIGFMSYDPDVVVAIPNQLEVLHQQITLERKRLNPTILQTDYLFLQVHNHLSEYGNYLKKLMSKQRLTHYPAKHMESLYVKLSASILKFKCIKLEIMLNTYTSTSVAALKFVSNHVNERTAKAERSLARLKHELSSFDKLDENFKSLLMDYAMIQANIAVYKNV